MLPRSFMKQFELLSLYDLYSRFTLVILLFTCLHKHLPLLLFSFLTWKNNNSFLKSLISCLRYKARKPIGNLLSLHIYIYVHVFFHTSFSSKKILY